MFNESALTDRLYSLLPQIERGTKCFINNCVETGRLLKRYLVDMDYGIYKEHPDSKKYMNLARLAAYGFTGSISGIGISLAVAVGDFKFIEQMSLITIATVSSVESSIRVVNPITLYLIKKHEKSKTS